ncbi:MAG: DUF2497 domain-containing protein [Holosporales bacterium]|jgi:cell pole-organizing protein PopZ|nr:DUF2497 domain-containing protein [Holosporales bacterium]
MADNIVDILDIDEILESIKKYVSSNENSQQNNLEKDDNPLENEVVCLTPFLDEDTEKNESNDEKDIKNISMPSFMKIASTSKKELSTDLEEFSSISKNDVKQSKKEDIQINNEKLHNDKTINALKGFVKNVNNIVIESRNKLVRPKESFDDFIAIEVKKAINLWINNNMQTIVEAEIEKELKRITEKLENI